MNVKHEYLVTQDLNSKLKLSSVVSIYGRDVAFVVILLGIAYVFQSLVTPSFLVIYWIVTIMVSVILAMPSPINPKRRNYQTLVIFSQRDTNTYYPLFMRERKMVKQKKKKTVSADVKTVADALPIIRYNKDYKCFQCKTGYMNILQVITKDIVNASEDEIEYDIAKLTKYNQLEYEDYKITALNYPCNTMKQQAYLHHKLDTIKNKNFQKYLKNSLYELEWIQDRKSKREFFLSIYSDSLDGIKKMEADMKAALQSRDKMIMDLSQDKKEKIYYRLNNPASVLLGGE